MEADLTTLRGDPLFEALVDAGDIASLALLWRADQPELAVRLAGPLARARDPGLADLLLSELAHPVMPVDAVRPSIMAAIAAHLPPLSPAGLALLDADLRADAYAALVTDAAAEAALEVWLFAQPGSERDEYAILIVEGGADTATAQATMAAALGRCRQDGALRERAAVVCRAALEEGRDAPSWAWATRFVEEACDAYDPGPEVLALVRAVIGLAPALAMSRAFGPVLTALVREHGQGAILSLLSGDALGSSLGMSGLLDISNAFGRADDRLAVFMTAFGGHPALRPVLDEIAATWDATRWRQALKRVLRTPAADLPDQVAPLLIKAPVECSALLAEIGASRARLAADPSLDAVVATRIAEAYRVACDARASLAAVLHWPKGPRDEKVPYLAARIAAGVGSDDAVDLVGGALLEGLISPDLAAALLPAGLSWAFIEQLRVLDAPEPTYRGVLDALHADRPDELQTAAADLQGADFDLRIAQVLADTAPGVAFAGAREAYDVLASPDRDVLLDLLEEYAEPAQIGVVERFSTANEKTERGRRARSFGIVARLLPKGSVVPEYLEDGLRAAVPQVSRAAFAAVGAIAPRDPAFLRSLREIANGDGAGARDAAASLEAMTASSIDDLQRPLGLPERCEILERLGAAARPAALDVVLDHLGNAEIDAVALHRAAATAAEEAVPFITVTGKQLERLSDLLDGEHQENDPQVRGALTRAVAVASLGPDEAVALLYNLARCRPTSTPDQLFGPEKGILLRQLGLFKRESDRGAAGMAVALVHLDNVAERIARAAYTRFGSSEPMKQQIAASARQPDYGQILGALDGPLEKAKAGFATLHDTRNEGTEVPHPGTQLTAEAHAAAVEGFQRAANVCLMAIDEAELAEG